MNFKIKTNIDLPKFKFNNNSNSNFRSSPINNRLTNFNETYDTSINVFEKSTINNSVLTDEILKLLFNKNNNQNYNMNESFKTISNMNNIYCRQFDITKHNIINNLKNGKEIILKTNNNEYIMLLGITDDGKVISKILTFPSSEFNPFGKIDMIFDLDTIISKTDYNGNNAWLFIPKDKMISREDINMYYQTDYRGIPYGGYEIGESGCGPTSSAIVISSLTDMNVDPIETANWYNENGFQEYTGGTNFEGIDDIMLEYGLKTKRIEPTPESIYQALENGEQIIVNVGPGTFTTGGHYMVLAGVAENNEIILCDPYSREFSSKTWPVEIFIDERQKFSGTTSLYSCYIDKN